VVSSSEIAILWIPLREERCKRSCDLSTLLSISKKIEDIFVECYFFKNNIFFGKNDSRMENKLEKCGKKTPTKKNGRTC